MFSIYTDKLHTVWYGTYIYIYSLHTGVPPPLGCGVSALITVPLMLPDWSTSYVRIISVQSWTYSFVLIEQYPVYFMQSCLAGLTFVQTSVYSGFLTAVYRAIIPTSRGYSSTNKSLQCRRILGGRKLLDYVRTIVTAVFVMTGED